MNLCRNYVSSCARWLVFAAILALVSLLTLSCSRASLTYDASTDLYLSKRSSVEGPDVAQKLREQMEGWEIPYRGPFRLPDGRVAMPRGLPPIGLETVFRKSVSELPCIWGLDGRAAGPTGEVNIIVAKVAFNDFKENEIARTDLEEWFFNMDEGPVPDSLSEYYHRESFGQLAVDGIVLPETGSYEIDGDFIDFIFPMYPSKYATMWDSLVSQIDADVEGADFDGNNDGAIDAIIVVPPYGDYLMMGGPLAFVDNHAVSGMYSGKIDEKDVETYSIQSNVFGNPLHRYAVPWHEFGHVLGLPDLYDGGGMGPPEPGPDGDDGMGPGGWAVMCQSGHIAFNLPVSAPMKLLLGWGTPVELPTDLGFESDYHLLYANEEKDCVHRVTLGGGTYYIGPTPVEYDEYLLFEARSLTPPGMPDDGMLVWHINENVYLEKVLSGAQPELPNSDEEYKFTDIVETSFNADSIVDKPYDGSPSSLVRPSDLWPYDNYDELRSTVPTDVGYKYKHSSLLPALPNPPYFDIGASLDISVTDIARVEDGITFHYEVAEEPPPPPPEVVSFTPLITYSGSGSNRRAWLHLDVTGNETATSFTITLDYLDGEGLPQSEQWESAGGDLLPVDITPLLPNQRITLSVVASDGAVQSDPVTEQLDAVTLLGDVNADDNVNDADAAALQGVLGLSEADADYRAWYDTDGDDFVDEQDLAYIGYWYGQEREEE